jgi:hypothetical protein
MTLSDLHKMRAVKVAWETADAYSADMWGPVAWVQAAEMLLAMDFSEAETRAILRSKMTRWARDGWGDPATFLGALYGLAYDNRDAVRRGDYGDGEIGDHCATPTPETPDHDQ